MLEKKVRELERAVSQLNLFVYDVTSVFLNVTLNSVAIAFILDKSLILGFIVGMALGSTLLLWSNPKISTISESWQGKRLQLTNTVLNIWDNVVLGNRSNRNEWNKRRESHFQNAANEEIELAMKQQYTQLLATYVTFLPTLLILASLIMRGPESNFLLSLSVTLPRLFQILNSSHHLSALVTTFASLRGKANRFQTILMENWGACNLEDRINRENITINNEPLVSTSFVLPQRGRFTVRGKNGAGKSSLLQNLRLSHDSFLLPAQHNLCFSSDLSGSTGERLLQAIDQLPRIPGQVVLLDEWDANLDSTNVAKIHAAIDELAAETCVVEVRHRA